MRTKLSYAILALAAGAASAPAGAQMVTAANPDTIVKALQGEGYAAKLEKDSEGDPMIVSASDGTTFRIYFYGCTGGKACETVQFSTAYDAKGETAVALMNQWNHDKRFARAFLDKDGDPNLQMDLDLDDGGLSKALFVDNFEFWLTLKQSFEKHIGWGGK
jgi:hypothetical protein